MNAVLSLDHCFINTSCCLLGKPNASKPPQIISKSLNINLLSPKHPRVPDLLTFCVVCMRVFRRALVLGGTFYLCVKAWVWESFTSLAFANWIFCQG